MTLNPGNLEILTAENGKFDRGPALRKICALLSDGTIYVHKDEANSPPVTSLMFDCQRRNFKVKMPELVDITEIEGIYKQKQAAPRTIQDKDKLTETALGIIAQAVETRASDIHIIVKPERAELWMRVDNLPRMVRTWTHEEGHELCNAYFTIAQESHVTAPNYQPRERQFGEISSRNTPLPKEIDGVRCLWQAAWSNGRHFAARLNWRQLGSTTKRVTLAGLGYTPKQLAQMDELRARPYGLVAFIGPMGSGKTTAQHRMLEEAIKERDGRCIAVEVADPIEGRIDAPGVVQTTFYSDTTQQKDRSEALSQAQAGILRSDANIVVAPEILDAAAANLALDLAMIGRLVFATVHVNTVMELFDRLRSLNVDDYKRNKASYIAGAVGQRLIGQLCPECSIPAAEETRPLRKATLFRMSKQQLRVTNVRFASPTGCAKCKDGYIGRTVIAEVLVTNRDFMELVRKNEHTAAEEYWRTRLEGESMFEHGIRLAQEGRIDPHDLELCVGRIHKDTDPYYFTRIVGKRAA